MKYVVYAVQYKVLRKERLTGAGGMPSSHSSGVCTLIVIMARHQEAGVQSPMFAIALILGLIVMYDAAGVRRAAGLHAKVINMLRISIDELDGNTSEKVGDKAIAEKSDEKPAEKPLKEFVGHTPLEVLCGAMLGIFIGFMFAV